MSIMRSYQAASCRLLGLVCVLVLHCRLGVAADKPTPARCIRDAIWVWGNPEMTIAGSRGPGEYAQASPARRAELLGTTNIILAGAGLPSDRELAARWTAEVADSRELIWEILPDGHTDWQPPYVFEQRIADVAPLVKRHPQITAVLVDDMTSVAASRGFRPEHLRAIKDTLQAHQLPLDLWGVVYTMNLDAPGVADLMAPLDVVLLAEWHAAEVLNLAKNVARARELAPDKPIVLGLYLHDYGGGRPIPQDLLELQFTTARQLLLEGAIAGIEITTIDNNESAVRWTAEWIRKHGDEPLKAAKR
jgi:hypothetical protein